MEKSLYKITGDYIELETQLIENEGELTDELIQSLKINKDELKVKSKGYIGIINKLGSEIDFIKLEVQRLQKLKKQRENAQKALKSSIEATMQVYDIEKIELELNTISFRKSESVQINCDVNDLPSDCKKIKVEAISKIELKKMLKEGRVIDGVEIIKNKTLNIK